MASYFFDMKSARPGTAEDSYAYANRTGRYSRSKETNDLVASGHRNLPEGFDNDPIKFLATGDRYERRNGAVVRKLILALPRELPLAEQEKLVVDFLDATAPCKPSGYAIHHPKQAAFGDDGNPHTHVWLCDRIPDGIPRERAQFFRRAHPTVPELGGCRKDSGGKDPQQAKESMRNMRRAWADLQNLALEAGGHPDRVTHLSLREQKVDRKPEPRFGFMGVKRMDQGAKDEIRASRRTA